MTNSTTHINVLNVGSYGDYLKAGQLLKVVSIGKSFAYVESFTKKAVFKISLKTSRACGIEKDGISYWISAGKQPSFELPAAA